MSYAVMIIEKIKTIGDMQVRYKHNCDNDFRREHVKNVIPYLTCFNEELIPSAIRDDSTTRSYRDLFIERLQTLPHYEAHSIRKNQVLAYEILLTFSRDEMVNSEHWKQNALNWLLETFNLQGYGSHNVLSASYHIDEAGNDHIHAFVVPIDERGHLNARRFTNGSRRMEDLQTSYADALNDLQIKRGIRGSTAKPKTIRKLYGELNAIQIPMPKSGESADAYRMRILEDAETLYASKKYRGDAYMVSARQTADQLLYDTRKEAAEEREAERALYEAERNRMEAEQQELLANLAAQKKELEEKEEHLQKLLQDLWTVRYELEENQQLRTAAKKLTQIETGIRILAKESPGLARQIETGLELALEKGMQEEDAQQAQRNLSQQMEGQITEKH